MPRPIRMYQNKSSHERLLHDAMYSIKELSMILEIPRSTLSNRLSFSDVLTDNHVKPTKEWASPSKRTSPWPQLESKADMISNEHLRKPLLCP